jgi:hypothetical protein
LGDAAGDQELVLAALRVATIRSKLVSNVLDSIGVSLKQKLITAEDALTWARDEGLLGLLQFSPPSKGDAQ